MRRGRAVGGHPYGLSGHVPSTHPSWERHVWFTLFVPEGARARATAKLGELAARHRAVWAPLDDYLYRVQFRTFNPPLVYPVQETFLAVGVWGVIPESMALLDVDGLRALELDFAGLVAAETAYRRYVQSELTFGEFDYAGYFGDEVFTGFFDRKRECDPGMILGRGTVFPHP